MKGRSHMLIACSRDCVQQRNVWQHPLTVVSHLLRYDSKILVALVAALQNAFSAVNEYRLTDLVVKHLPVTRWKSELLEGCCSCRRHHHQSFPRLAHSCWPHPGHNHPRHIPVTCMEI